MSGTRVRSRSLRPRPGRDRSAGRPESQRGRAAVDLRLQFGHHNVVKNRGYSTWRDDAGRWRITRPDATEIAPA